MIHMLRTLKRKNKLYTQISNIRREIKNLWKYEKEMLGTRNAAKEIKNAFDGLQRKPHTNRERIRSRYLNRNVREKSKNKNSELRVGN